MMVQGLGSLQREFIEFRLHYRVPLRYYKGTTGSVANSGQCRRYVDSFRWFSCIFRTFRMILWGGDGEREGRMTLALTETIPRALVITAFRHFVQHTSEGCLTFLQQDALSQLPCLAEHA